MVVALDRLEQVDVGLGAAAAMGEHMQDARAQGR
jgi:hypothetical protein